MKKIALATVAAAALAASGGAYAYTSGTFSNGFVVPNVIHNGSSQTTAVGIINRSGGDRGIWWTFFDQNSTHITDGCFAMTDKEYKSFNWMEYSGLDLENERGYLVFAAGDPGTADEPNAPCSVASLDPDAELSANAFFVDTAADDVAFTPVIDGPVTITDPLNTMDKDSLTMVGGAAQKGNDELHMRYTIGGGDTTRIMVWSTGDHSGTHTVFMYNDQQDSKSVNFKLNFEELDWFDPATIPGRPAGFTDGFLVWDASKLASSGGPNDSAPGGPTSYAGKSGGSIYSFSYVGSPDFNAVQTLLASHR